MIKDRPTLKITLPNISSRSPGYKLFGVSTLKALPTKQDELDKLDARVTALLIQLPQDKKAEVLNNAASIAQRAFNIAIAEKKTENQANDSASTAYVNAIIGLATKEIESEKNPKSKDQGDQGPGIDFDPNAEIPKSDLSSDHEEEKRDGRQ